MIMSNELLSSDPLVVIGVTCNTHPITSEAKAEAELWWLDLPPRNDRAGRPRSLTWSTGRPAALRYSILR